MKDQRKSERFSCLVPVDGKQGGLFEKIQTVDFSRGGIGFISHRKIPLNREVAIELDFGESEPVIVIAKVRWVRPFKSDTYRVGMYFESLMPGSKSRLNQYFQTEVGGNGYPK